MTLSAYYKANRNQAFQHYNPFFWRRKGFLLSLQIVDDYLDILESNMSEQSAGLSRQQLLRYSENALLDAASKVSPFCVSTANLFSYSNTPDDKNRQLYSSNFIGPMQPRRLLLGKEGYRNMQTSETEPFADLAVAVQAAMSAKIQMRSLEDTRYRSIHELESGLTHVIALPAHTHRLQYRYVSAQTAAAITIELKVHKMAQRLLPTVNDFSNQQMQLNAAAMHRCEQLTQRLNRLAQIQAVNIAPAQQSTHQLGSPLLTIRPQNFSQETLRRNNEIVELLRRSQAERRDVRAILGQFYHDLPETTKHSLTETTLTLSLLRLAASLPEVGLATDHLLYSRHSRPLLERFTQSLADPGQQLANSFSAASLDDAVFRATINPTKPTQDDSLHLAAIYNVIPQLTATEEVARKAAHTTDLRNTFVVAQQHILGSVISQFKILTDYLGLQPSNCIIKGKPYSSNRLAAHILQRLGYTVFSGLRSTTNFETILNPTQYHFDLLEEIDLLAEQAIARALHQGCDSLLIIDSGGLLTNAVLQKMASFKGNPTLRIAAVEQTTFGLSRSNNLIHTSSKAAVPVVSVATSRFKTLLEGPLVGESVVKEIEQYLSADIFAVPHLATARAQKVAIVGYGTISSQIAQALVHKELCSKKDIYIYDFDPKKLLLAQAAGFTRCDSLNDALRNCSIVIGSTGSIAGLPLRHASWKDQTIFVSTASFNTELQDLFSSNETSELTTATYRRQGNGPYEKIHGLYRTQVGLKEALILNGGFPINFTGGVDPIAADKAEIIRTIMVAGIAQAKRCLDQIQTQSYQPNYIHLEESNSTAHRKNPTTANSWL